MAKTEKELNELKKKVEEVNNALEELSEDELSQVAGGGTPLRRKKSVFTKTTPRKIPIGT